VQQKMTGQKGVDSFKLSEDRCSGWFCEHGSESLHSMKPGNLLTG
jgi:hypothetical protein